jgi:hypothetical protein
MRTCSARSAFEIEARVNCEVRPAEANGLAQVLVTRSGLDLRQAEMKAEQDMKTAGVQHVERARQSLKSALFSWPVADGFRPALDVLLKSTEMFLEKAK